jgi:hypothetical protein
MIMKTKAYIHLDSQGHIMVIMAMGKAEQISPFLFSFANITGRGEGAGGAP